MIPVFVIPKVALIRALLPSERGRSEEKKEGNIVWKTGETFVTVFGLAPQNDNSFLKMTRAKSSWSHESNCC